MSDTTSMGEELFVVTGAFGYLGELARRRDRHGSYEDLRLSA